MTGLCGATGDATDSLHRVSNLLRWTGREDASTYDDEVRLRVVHHPSVDGEIVATAGGARVAVWGDVFGYRSRSGYRARDPKSDDSAARYVAGLYEQFGPAVFRRLNGQYAAAVLDEHDESLLLVSDHVASHPLYYARTTDGDLVFSSNVQSLPFHPDVRTEYDGGLLAEYFTYRCVFGTETPLVGVRQVPPASVTRFDLATGSVQSERYWEPVHRPSDRSYRSLVREFAELFVRVLRERVDPNERYGVLLSGGGDSRLLLAALDELDAEVVALHSNEWENHEADVARRVADTVGVPFRFLHRSPEYQSTLLRSNGPLSQFNSTFTQGYMTPFADDVSDVDVVLSGDTREELVGAHLRLPTRDVYVGIGTTDVPFLEPIDTVEEYVDYLRTSPPSYVTSSSDLYAALSTRARGRPDGSVEFHGVTYPSLTSLKLHFELYPFTNDADYVDNGGLYYLTRHWSPFLDVRMLEFATRLPIKLRLRRRFVMDAVAALDPELARLPDANTGISGTAPFAAHEAVRYGSKLRQKYLPKPTPAPHFSHGSWTDHRELIRTDDFLAEFFDERTHLVDAFDFLSQSGLDDLYRSHLDGESNHWPLYTLATFLAMPVTEHLAG
jgi:asparagine synthase (glutamine-hydrolysing)